eukprot:Seg814.6 transcript_id=Seg814.6/GoldUCD/mRNA.D3Y31 product="hypothetical protein" protein_id=Seg814.6/GoldUCD/D3Y31
MEKLPSIETQAQPKEFNNLWDKDQKLPDKLPALHEDPDFPMRNSIFGCFSKFKGKSIKHKGDRYRPQSQQETIEEDREMCPESSTIFADDEGIGERDRSSSVKFRRKRKKLKEKSASFDYADLRNEIEYPSRINLRRTAICAKSKSTDAMQLETFIVVSRLKQFDLL